MLSSVRRLAVSCLLAPVLLASLGAADDAPADSASITILAAPGVPGGVLSIQTQIEARITAKDEAKRTLTLLGADGKEQTLVVPESAVNFPQAKVGDTVVATVTETIAAVVIPAAAPVAQGEAALAVLAEEGGKPGLALAAAVQIRAKIAAIDATARTATIASDDGKSRVLPVRADIDLALFHVGDQVVLRVVSAIALEVKAPASK